MDPTVKKYVISLIFYRINNAIKTKTAFKSKIINIKGLGKFIIGDLKTEKRFRKKMYGYNKKYLKKMKIKAKNKMPDELDKLL